jgi:hypothetical protein
MVCSPPHKGKQNPKAQSVGIFCDILEKRTAGGAPAILVIYF